MPSLSIAVLFDEILPKHAFLMGGKANTSFNWVRTISSEDEASERVSAGELVLISPKLLAGHTDTNRVLTQVIARLIQARVSAFAVQGAVEVFALEDAIHKEMAVIYLPDDASTDKIERAVLRLLNEQQSLIEQYEQDLQRAISRPGSIQQNIVSLVQVLAELIERPVALHDAHRLRITHAFPESPVDPRTHWNQHLVLLDDDRSAPTMLTGGTFAGLSVLENEKVLQVVLTNDTETIGYLSVIKDERPLRDITPLVLKRATQLCVQLMNKYLVNITSDEHSGDWITNWLHSPPANDMLITAHAEQTGFSNEQTYVLMVMRALVDGTQRRPLSPEQFTEYVSNETRTKRINAIVGQYIDRTVMFLPLEQAQHTGRMKQYAHNICKSLADQLGTIVIGGVGRPGVGLTELRRSFNDAERAHILACQLTQETQTRFFGDLRLSELLLSIGDIDRIHDFYQDWLSSVLDYDQESRSDLLMTMAAYFGNNGNMAATAKQLNVHRNTLVYRLNRIAEITQLDMDDAGVQLNLHLAIKAYQLLETMGLI